MGVGKVFVGGMALSTLLVPFYVPICLSLLQDAGAYLGGIRNWFVARTHLTRPEKVVSEN